MLQDFCVVGTTVADLKATLKLASQIDGGAFNIVGYRVSSDGMMHLYTIRPTKTVEGLTMLPQPVPVKQFVGVIWSWLTSAETKKLFETQYRPSDIDGSVELGWKVTASGSSWDDILCPLKVSLTWLYYHK